MTKEEFVNLIGKDVVVDYPFGKELQQWSMKNFTIVDGVVKHNRLPLIMDAFISNARNPHAGSDYHLVCCENPITGKRTVRPDLASYDGFANKYLVSCYGATHWMPMPQPPKEET